MSQIQVYNPSGGGGGGPILTLTGNTGGAVGPTGGNINVVGTGAISITGNPGTSTLTASVTGGGLSWVVAAVSQGMAVNTGYISNGAGLITLTLPAVAAVGDVVRVGGLGAGGWRVAQNAGQQIHQISADTTIGVGGSLSSTNRHDAVELVCVVANTTFLSISSQGNLTYV